jgi:hypothetical protein
MGCNICNFSNNECIIEEDFKFQNGKNDNQKDNLIMPTSENKPETKENMNFLSQNININKEGSSSNNLKKSSFNSNNDINNNNSDNNIKNNNNNDNNKNNESNVNNNNYNNILVDDDRKKIIKSLIKNKCQKEIENKVEESSNILSSNKVDYNTRVIDLINQIRIDPEKYAEIILNNIQFIYKELRVIANDETGQNEEKEEIFFQKKVKVKLNKGEKAFISAADYIRNIEPMNELMIKDEIKLMLPENETELDDNEFIKKQLMEIRKNYGISAFFKDNVKNPEVGVLLMIVGDSKNNENKKRNAILNPEYKYISVNSKFLGDSFIAFYSFSK